jgi:phosphatidylethanolamine/phosphatidyl-N-methylethanolamine N-methyltransferase
MALKQSYTLLAPIYDAIVSGPIDAYREKSLSRMPNTNNNKILISGIGSGLDIPYLTTDACYIGTDITPAMLKRANSRAKNYSVNITFQEADSQDLPFENNSFDAVILHLILAVVPKPELALKEACRVLKPGGRIYIFDKFIRSGQIAIVRRLLNIFLRHIATRTDVIFEDALETCPQLVVIHDEPALAKGWFRLIELRKLSVGSR